MEEWIIEKKLLNKHLLMKPQIEFLLFSGTISQIFLNTVEL